MKIEDIPQKFKVPIKSVTKSLMRNFYDWRSRFGPCYTTTEEEIEFFSNLKLLLNKGKKLLDLGCGIGNVDLVIAKYGVQITGVDLSSKQIKICNSLKIEEAKFYTKDLAHLNLKDEFDIVFSYDVLEHLFPCELKLVLKNAVKHVKVGGFIFLVWDSPNYLAVLRPHRSESDYRNIDEGFQPTDFLVYPYEVRLILMEYGMTIIVQKETPSRILMIAKK